MTAMSEPNEMSANLHHQLTQREIDSLLQRSPQAFTANLYRERYRLAKNLYKSDLRAHYGCVNAIEFSNGGKYLASGGDDKRVLVWDIEMAIAGLGRPRVLDTEHTSNIFCLGFDRPNRKVFSGGNDDLVIVHDFETGKLDNVYKHDNPVYGLSIDPQCDSIFATACEDGQILIFDQRIDPSDPLVVAQLRTSFHAVEFHPSGGNYLVTANSQRGAAFWDIRKPHHPVIQYGYLKDPPSCMSVRFNSTGSLILALRRRLPPILYNTQSAEPVCTFYHGNYYNSCTMKSCTFAGEDDEFVLSGSDDFNLYVWRVSDVDLERTDQWIETTQMVLYGHRSIVNQVRYNRQKCLLASSGVEKIIKLWSPFAQRGWTGSLLNEANSSDNPRDLYSPYNIPSMSTPPHSWSHMSHDYSSRNTNEDPRMMAFFDSLIQQEIEGWNTNRSTDGSCTNSSSNDSSDSSLDDDDDDDDGTGGAGDATGPRTERRLKRNLVRRKERKRMNSNATKSKIQRNKYANRIAYLIATKRNTLRRLAIKGASISNRGPTKIVKVGRNKKCVDGRNARTLVNKRNAYRMNSMRNNVPVASTSASAAVASCSGYRSQRRKHKKQRLYDSSSDDDNELGNPIASGSGRATYSSNIIIPSTSTGITSSLKDDIIRLRQQQQNIDDSDEDEDDDYPPRRGIGSLGGLATITTTTQQHNEIVVDPTVQPTKKLNGVRRTNDAAVMGRSSSGAPSVNTHAIQSRHGGGNTVIQRTQNIQQQEPQLNQRQLRSAIATTAEANDAAAAAAAYIDITTATTTGTATTLPFGAITTNLDEERPTTTAALAAAENTSTTTTIASKSTQLPQLSNNTNNNNNNNCNIVNRRRPHVDLLDQYSSHSYSRLSNSSYPDEEALEDTTTSSASSPPPTQETPPQATPSTSRKAAAKLKSNSAAAAAAINGNNVAAAATPFKRRKLAIAEYINVRCSSTTINDDEVNNNEQNNNDIFCVAATTASNGNNNHFDCNNINQVTEEEDEDEDAPNAAQFIVVTRCTTPTTDYCNHNNNSSSSISSNQLEQDQQQQQQYSDNVSNILLQTPDSGISVATLTPFSSGSNSNSSSIRNTSTAYCNGNTTPIDGDYISQQQQQHQQQQQQPQQLRSPCNDNANSNKVSINLFHQKVARVRRNYRKKFADESDSD